MVAGQHSPPGLVKWCRFVLRIMREQAEFVGTLLAPAPRPWSERCHSRQRASCSQGCSWRGEHGHHSPHFPHHPFRGGSARGPLLLSDDQSGLDRILGLDVPNAPEAGLTQQRLVLGGASRATAAHG